MADTWLTPDKKEGLLKYIEEGANEEDLLAAGYTKNDLTEVGWYQPTKWEAGPHHPEAKLPETVDTYTPTRRENLRGNVEGLLTKFGAPEGAAYNIATGLVGTENDVGIADFSPLGLVFGAQEGKRQIERGINAGDKSDVALGTLNLGLSAAEAIPGVGALAKGVSKLASKTAKNYDPTVVRTFFGPESKKADLLALKRAKEDKENGFSPEEIWSRHGWYESPKNGWRFEVDDSNLKLPESIENRSAKTSVGDNTQIFKHPDFWDALQPGGRGRYSFFKEVQNAEDTANSTGKVGFEKPASYNGQFNPHDLSIESYGGTPDDIRQTAVHELQHAEQTAYNRDGSGSNPSFVGNQFAMFLDDLPKKEVGIFRDAMKLGHAEASLEDLNSTVTNIQAFVDAKNSGKAVSNWYGSNPEEKLKEATIEQENLQNFVDSYKKSLEEDFNKLGLNSSLAADLQVFQDTAYNITKYASYKHGTKPTFFDKQNPNKLSSWAEHALYEMEAGEAEARLAMDRFQLTEAERAENPPSTWLDVHPEMVYTEADMKSWQKSVKDKINNKPKFAEGGAVTNVDPVSGNEIPPGSLPQEVRDDVDAKLSEGEYVLPADVVRYFGLDYIEKLVNKAKQGMEEFQSNGRIGGKTDEDLPFSPEELQAHEQEMASGPPQMAVGGLVPSAGGITDETTKPPVDPVTGLPWWLLQQKQQEQQEVKAPAVKTQSDRETARLAEEPKGLAGSVDKWSTKDFITYANTRGNTANRIIETGIASVIPLGGLALKARYKYLDKNVPTQLDSMIASGKDAAGNPISAAELAELKAAKEKLASSGSYTPGVKGAGAGLGGIFKGGLGNLFGGNKEKAAPATTPSKPAATTPASKPTSTPTKTTSTPSQAARAGFGKGGLITRR